MPLISDPAKIGQQSEDCRGTQGLTVVAGQLEADLQLEFPQELIETPINY